jgi:hypothetical protein
MTTHAFLTIAQDNKGAVTAIAVIYADAALADTHHGMTGPAGIVRSYRVPLAGPGPDTEMQDRAEAALAAHDTGGLVLWLLTARSASLAIETVNPAGTGAVTTVDRSAERPRTAAQRCPFPKLGTLGFDVTITEWVTRPGGVADWTDVQHNDVAKLNEAIGWAIGQLEGKPAEMFRAVAAPYQWADGGEDGPVRKFTDPQWYAEITGDGILWTVE